MLDERYAVEPLAHDDPLRSLFDGDAASSPLPAGVRDRVQSRLASSLAAAAAVGELHASAGAHAGAGSAGTSSVATGGAGAGLALLGGKVALTVVVVGTVGGALLGGGMLVKSWLVAPEPLLQAPKALPSLRDPQAAPPAATLPLPPPSSTLPSVPTAKLDLHELPARETDARVRQPLASPPPATVESSLAREVRLLRQAQSLASTDAKAARQILDDYAREFPHGKLSQESMKLRAKLNENATEGEAP